jgi:hypothetical protein
MLVELLGVRRNVRGNLSLQRSRKHPPRALTHYLVDQRRAGRGGLPNLAARTRWRRLIISDYGEHGRTLPDPG